MIGSQSLDHCRWLGLPHTMPPTPKVSASHCMRLQLFGKGRSRLTWCLDCQGFALTAAWHMRQPHQKQACA